MKNLLLALFLVILPTLILTSAACPDCIDNIDITDKKSVITCVITVLFGLIVRHIERKKLKKRSKKENNNNSSGSEL
jgi:glycopeptide antibiotics resistance protein